MPVFWVSHLCQVGVMLWFRSLSTCLFGLLDLSLWLIVYHPWVMMSLICVHLPSRCLETVWSRSACFGPETDIIWADITPYSGSAVRWYCSCQNRHWTDCWSVTEIWSVLSLIFTPFGNFRTTLPILCTKLALSCSSRSTTTTTTTTTTTAGHNYT